MECLYSLEDYCGFGNFDYTLPDDIIGTIRTLDNNFIPIDNHRNVKKYERRGNRKNHNGQNSPHGSNNGDWESLRKFTSTQINVEKEGFDGILTSIRNLLNKTSNKNHEAHQSKIVQHVKDIIEEGEELDERLKKVAGLILETSSVNKMYSLLYVYIYKELLGLHNIFHDSLQDSIEKYCNEIMSLKYVDSDDNYEEFCIYNKQNDKRKGVVVFLTNLVGTETLNVDILVDILQKLQCRIFELSKVEGKSNEVNELIENMHVIINSKLTCLFETNIWKEEILPNIKKLIKDKKENSDGNISLSSRSSFRCMDILDFLNESL